MKWLIEEFVCIAKHGIRSTEYADFVNTLPKDRDYFDTAMTIATRILSWLKLEHKRAVWREQGRPATYKPMELSMQYYPWEDDLKHLINVDNRFSSLFQIADDQHITYAKELTLDQINEIRKYSFISYNPRRMV